MPTRKRSSGTTRTAETKKKLSRRAMIVALGAGLVGTGLRRTAKALPMPDPKPTPTKKDFGFSGPTEFTEGEWFEVNCSKPWIKVTCEKSGKLMVHCSHAKP